MLFDRAIKHVLSAAAQHCKADFTMFEGKEILGKAVYSMLRGRTLIENSEMKSEQGGALYLPGDVNVTASAPKGYKVG